MTRLPRWIINLAPGGRIVITSSDGTDLGEDDLKMLRMIVYNHFKADGQVRARGLVRPEAGAEVITKPTSKNFPGGRVRHSLDPIVNFFTIYRRKRQLQVKAVAVMMGTSASQVTSYEVGHSRPFVEVLRDWGYALGFNLMPVPIALSAKVRDMVNEHIAQQYVDDLNRWGNHPRFFREGVNEHADFSAGREFLRDGDYSRPQAPGEAASPGVPDPGDAGGTVADGMARPE